MKYATLAQGQKVLDLIVRKGIPAEQLQKLLEMGLIDDILDAFTDEVDRSELRAVLGLRNIHTVAVDYKLTTLEVVELYTGQKISHHDPLVVLRVANNRGSESTTIRMTSLRFKRPVYPLHVHEELAGTGLRTATLNETVALIAHERSSIPLVALGSPTEAHPKMYPVVHSKDEPRVTVEGPLFSTDYRFATVYR